MPIDRNEVEDKVKTILSKELGIDKEKISLEKKLSEDLGMDSFSSVEVIFTLEDMLGINIPDRDAIKLLTVNDVVNYIISQLASK